MQKPLFFSFLRPAFYHNAPVHRTFPLHLFFLYNPPTTFPSLLQTHALLLTTGHSTNPSFAAKLISLYASFSRPDLSSLVFRSATQPPDTFLWNSIIKSHFSNGDFTQSLRYYSLMHRSGLLPNHFTIPMVASACAELGNLSLGSSARCVSVKSALFFGSSGSAVGSSFVYFYSKCGMVGDARKVFEEMPFKDAVSWTALIMGCVSNGECEMGLACLKEMLRDCDERPNSRTIEAALQACRNLEGLWESRCLHGFLTKSGIACHHFIKSSLLSVYSKFGVLQEADLAFCELGEKDIISWTAIMGIYARNGLIMECLTLFQDMLLSGVHPDGVLISCLITAFACSSSVREGEAFHAVVLRRDFEFNAMVVNSLLSMYCKLELLDAANNIFNLMGEGDAESWNLMISTYGKMGLSFQCLDLFRKMQHLCLFLEPSSDSLVAVISSCSHLGYSKLGKSIHCYAIKSEADGVTSILNSLVGMYGRFGKFKHARRIFDGMSKDAVTWNTLISSHADAGHSSDALALFDQMLLGNVKPNSTSLKIVISVCARMASSHHGEWISNYIKEEELEGDVTLQTSLVDMYAKCGKLRISREIFDSMHERDVVSWNVMISGYGSHGHAREALHIFRKMEEMGARPNKLTFLAVLSACSHAGMIEEGRNLFARMKNFYSLIPTCKHYACMVDLLGRSGNLIEAEDMILKMPIPPDGGVWGALLSACKMHNDIAMGERAAKRAFELDPKNDGYYILMANLYGCAGRWDDAEKVRGMMKNRGMTKQAGWSAI